jgi:hypothetical protein
MLMTIFLACCAWAMTIGACVSAILSIEKASDLIKTLHQIPCSGCAFFTNDYRLKCTVNPINACTEAAIACRDFEPRTQPCHACRQCQHKFE